VVKEIIARIVRRQYPADSKLPAERRLSEELNVSRITIREALTRLVALNVIRRRHGSGNYVNSQKIAFAGDVASEIVGFGPEVLEEIVVAREAIETITAVCAARNRTQKELDSMERCLHRMATHTDQLDQFIEADMNFHRLMARAGKNRVMVKLMDAIEEQQRFSQVYTSYLKNDQAKAIRCHERILQAIVDQDEQAARRAVRRHLSDMKRYLEERKGMKK